MIYCLLVNYVISYLRLYYIILYSIVLYCIILVYCTVFYYNVLCYMIRVCFVVCYVLYVLCCILDIINHIQYSEVFNIHYLAIYSVLLPYVLYFCIGSNIACIESHVVLY